MVVAIMAMLLMTALGAALVLTTSSEAIIANNYRHGAEALYAADAVLERAIDEIGNLADWNTMIDPTTPGGVTRSAFADDGSRIQIDRTINMINCEKATPCIAAEMDAITADRPWGANNPRWQPYAYGNLARMLSPGDTITSPYYVFVLVADDPSETDNDPTRDGASPTNPGSGVLALRAEAFGPHGIHKALEATISRTALNGGRTGLRILSWREVR